MEYSLESEVLKIAANDKGAELFSLFSKKSEREYLWNGDEKYWSRRAPILFPTVGKLKDDKYKIENIFYFLKQHGFARDSVFNVKEATSKKIAFNLQENEDTLRMYPFRFSLIISYEIDENEVVITADVKNKENVAMPFSIGFHPAFVCPFEKGENLEEYCILFEKEEECERMFLEEGLIYKREPFSLKDKVFLLSEKLFSDDAVILRNPASDKVFLKKINSDMPIIEINFKGFNCLAFWKKKNAPFVCIEPWSGLNDFKNSDCNFLKKEGINLLKKNQSMDFTMSIRILE